MRSLLLFFLGGVFAVAGMAAPVAAPTEPAPSQRVPLCEGLTIVTAVAQRDGDYESIKTIESITPQVQRLNYSTERMLSDIFSTDPPKLLHI